MHNEQLARLSMLMDTDAFARATAQLAMLLLEASHRVPSVCLLPFAECEGFFDYRDYVGWQRNEYIRLGGLQLAFQHEVETEAVRWLHRCDQVLCDHHRESRGTDHAIGTFIDDMAQAIGRRLTFVHVNAEVSSGLTTSVDHLSARYIGGVLQSIMARSAVESENRTRSDAIGLRALLRIAQCESVEAVTSVVNDHTVVRFLENVLTHPPPELGWLGKCTGVGGMRLDRLLHIVRGPRGTWSFAMHVWTLQHGASTRHAVAEALKRLQNAHARSATGFVEVVSPGPPQNEGICLPSPDFVPGAIEWHLVPQTNGPVTRLGPVHSTDRRLLRLGSLLWQLDAYGYFPRASVPSTYVHSVATDALNSGQCMSSLVHHQRRQHNTGCRLLAFKRELLDGTSEVSHHMNVLMCEVSHFSVANLAAVCHPSGHLFESTIELVTNQTRSALVNKTSNAAYARFGRDALSLLFPIIDRNRLQLGINIYKIPLPLGDLIRSVRAVHDWSPLKGSFTLTLPMMKAAHPDLRDVLDNVAAQPNTLVNRSRWRGALTYTFDTMELRRILCS